MSAIFATTAATSLDALRRYESSATPDEIFFADMLERIEAARAQCVEPRRLARHGAPLRVLLLSYAGAGNTGADLRTIETIRQLSAVFATRRLDIELFARGNLFDHPVLAAVRKLQPLLPYAPDLLAQAMPSYDLVLNVEGSTYTSKFSDALAALLIGGAALAAAYGRPAFAYGIDSGAMTPALTRFAQQTADGVEILCRNEAAREALAALGIVAQAGADSAWTFAPRATARVRSLGGKVAALCPANPFWWPVTPRGTAAHEGSAAPHGMPPRYAGRYFHTWDSARALAYRGYIERFARIAAGLRADGFTPVLIAMEQLDRAACADIAAHVDFSMPCIARGEATLDDVAGAVGHAACVVTTRYHAAVLAVARGIPVYGLSMDERIDRLLLEAGLAGWHTACDDPHGAARALDALCGDASLTRHSHTFAERERVRFAAMGEALRAAVG
ncbi:polysaccharide pyruvyl transferase family protein [Paraburkholderia sediminicola]|uniref:polysaccharide pyruvyl transferase family protein n=1 Tax=Paraburkholderia sediminicola TaxID=458836 RepID=UPI0038BD1EDF